MLWGAFCVVLYYFNILSFYWTAGYTPLGQKWVPKEIFPDVFHPKLYLLKIIFWKHFWVNFDEIKGLALEMFTVSCNEFLKFCDHLNDCRDLKILTSKLIIKLLFISEAFNHRIILHVELWQHSAYTIVCLIQLNWEEVGFECLWNMEGKFSFQVHYYHLTVCGKVCENLIS